MVANLWMQVELNWEVHITYNICIKQTLESYHLYSCYLYTSKDKEDEQYSPGDWGVSIS